MTPSRLVCLKIGGSVITDKSTLLTPDMANIARFAANLSAVRRKFPGTALLLGNGAGSFGHHSAHAYGLGEGATTPAQFYGTGLTHNSVRSLNLMVGEALTAQDIPAYCLSPGDMFTAQNGEVLTANEKVVDALLDRAMVPVLHGDTVLDTERGVSIFSTEKSLFWLAEGLRSRYDHVTVVMVVDTGGVLNGTGAVLPELARDAKLPETPKIPGVADVTGGMAHKVAMCRKAAEWADNVYIIGNTEADLSAAFAGTPAGTKVL